MRIVTSRMRMDWGTTDRITLTMPRLLWAHASFQRNSSASYWELLGREPLSHSWRAQLFVFLNGWQCRITRDSETRSRIVSRIANIWNDLNPSAYHSNLVSYQGMPQSAYDELARVEWGVGAGRRRTLGATAAGKILHILRPDVFVMWDAAIRDAYGLGDAAPDYERFMHAMAASADALVSEFRRHCEDSKETLPRVICRLVGCAHPRPASLTKLLDEFNWLAITHSLRLTQS